MIASAEIISGSNAFFMVFALLSLSSALGVRLTPQPISFGEVPNHNCDAAGEADDRKSDEETE